MLQGQRLLQPSSDLEQQVVGREINNGNMKEQKGENKEEVVKKGSDFGAGKGRERELGIQLEENCRIG